MVMERVQRSLVGSANWDQRFNALGVERKKLKNDLNAHRMTGKDGLLDIELIKDGDQIVAKIFDVDDAFSSGFFAVSVPAIMGAHQLKVFVEIVDDVGPDEPIAGETVA